MTTKNQTIDNQKVADLLNACRWDYQYNMERINEATMAQYISEIEDPENLITAAEVESVIKGYPEDLAAEFNDSDEEDINEFSAKFIADGIAQFRCNCKYETVTFIAVIR